MSWLKRFFGSREPGPFIPAANPGRGVEARIAFSRGDRNWTEEVNIIESAAKALEAQSHAIARRGAEILHTDSGLVFKPLIAELHPLDNGGVRTVTTILTSHPDLSPEGIFEFQHGAGDNTE